jgi:hypothetical protein
VYIVKTKLFDDFWVLENLGSDFIETLFLRVLEKILWRQKKEHVEKPSRTKGKLDSFTHSQDSILMEHAY